ncbi:hypothetical protein BH23ACT6_BH23ACT6_17470 [soil metagenome]
MPPSSLIFAVILAVWAAYLMQHWVSRRDHIATARSVDRFSEAMRVLERRHQRAGVDFSAPMPRSYAVSPARPAAPDVVVKHAQPTPAAAIDHGGVAGQSAKAAAVVPRRRPAARAPRSRGLILLVAAAVMVIATGLGMFAVLPWWTALIGVGVFAVTLFAVRISVRRAAHTSEGATPVARSGVARPGVARPGVAAGRTQAPVGTRRRMAQRRTDVRRSTAAAGGGAAAALAANVQAEAEELIEVVQEAVTAAVRPPSSALVYDVEAVEQVIAAVPAAEVNAAPAQPAPAPLPGTWQPVPVPPPTYTLKAKAHSRVLPSELPADGTIVSLEEEDEELPTAIRGLA